MRRAGTLGSLCWLAALAAQALLASCFVWRRTGMSSRSGAGEASRA